VQLIWVHHQVIHHSHRVNSNLRWNKRLLKSRKDKSRLGSRKSRKNKLKHNRRNNRKLRRKSLKGILVIRLIRKKTSKMLWFIMRKRSSRITRTVFFDYFMIVLALNNMAAVYIEMGDLEKAME